MYISPSLHAFNEDYLEPRLEKLNTEKKNLILVGDFNINLLNYDCNNDTNDFLNIIQSNSLIPLILKPARLTAKISLINQTLIL